MRYYKQIKAALIVAFIALICLWFYGCGSFTETDLPKSQLIKTAAFKDVKTATACYAQMMITRNSDGISSLMGNTERSFEQNTQLI